LRDPPYGDLNKESKVAKSETTKKIEAKEGLTIYLNPIKSVMFNDELSGIKLGFFEGWNDSIVIPACPTEKLSVIQKALDLEILLTSPPKPVDNRRNRIVEDDPTLTVEANKLLSSHAKVIGLELQNVKSKDLIEIMIQKEKKDQNREIVLDMLAKRLSVLDGDKTVIDNDKVEEEFTIKNIVEK